MDFMVVLFDGGCPMCRRLVRRLQRLDWRHRLTFADATDARVRLQYAPGLDEATALTAMHVVAPDGSIRSGFDGFLRIARVVPLLWLPGAIGALPGIRSLGRFVYALVAGNRTRLRQGSGEASPRCTDEACAPSR